MLEHAALEVSRYAGVEGFGAVGHDVDIIEMGMGMHSSFTSLAFLLSFRMTRVWGDVCDG